MKLQLRGGIAALAIVGSALVATGCGSDSGATSAAKGAKALDFVPKTALGYVTVDTDFDGDGWKQFSKLATAFDPDFDSIEDQVAKSTSNSEDEVDYAKDVDPWLGDSAGAALLGLGSGDSDDAEYFAWVDVDDKAAFEKFAEKRDFEKGKKVGDFQAWKSDDDTVVGVSDDLAILTTDEAMLKQIVEYDGDPITDADGVEDAIDEVDGDALGTLVVNGEGIRAAAKDNAQAKQFADLEQLKDFRAFALSVGTEDDGFKVDGHALSDGDSKLENIDHAILEDLPANTVLAIGGDDLGGQVKSAVEAAGKDNPQIQQGAGALTAVLGVDLDDLAKALDGEFVLGLAADDQGLGGLAGGVAGAAMGGGMSGVNPTSLLQAGTVLLAFEETGSTGETLGKVAQAAGALGGQAGAAGAKTETVGDFTVHQATIGGVPVTQASSKDVAALSVGVSPFADWGKETLGDSDSFKDAWEAADAPDKTFGTLWLDAGRIATLAGVKSGDDAKLGGLVGWIEGDGSDAHIGAFLHVTEG